MIKVPTRNFRAAWLNTSAGTVTADVVTSDNEVISLSPFTLLYSDIWLVDVSLADSVTYCTIRWYLDSVITQEDTYVIDSAAGIYEQTSTDLITTQTVTELQLVTVSTVAIETYQATSYESIYKVRITVSDPGQLFGLWKNDGTLVAVVPIFVVAYESTLIPVEFILTTGNQTYPNILITSTDTPNIDGITGSDGKVTLRLPTGDHLIALKDFSRPDRWLSPSLFNITVQNTNDLPMTIAQDLLFWDPPSTEADNNIAILRLTLKAGDHPMSSVRIEVRQLSDTYNSSHAYSKYLLNYYTDTYGHAEIPLVKNSLVDIRIPVLHYAYVFTVPDKDILTLDDITSEAWSNPQLVKPNLPEY